MMLLSSAVPHSYIRTNLQNTLQETRTGGLDVGAVLAGDNMPTAGSAARDVKNALFCCVEVWDCPTPLEKVEGVTQRR